MVPYPTEHSCSAKKSGVRGVRRTGLRSKLDLSCPVLELDAKDSGQGEDLDSEYILPEDSTVELRS